MLRWDFIALHETALEANEIRHSLLLAMIGRLRVLPEATGPRWWTVGGPGECAMQTPGYPIVLGDLSKDQCRTLAAVLKGSDYPGVVGPGETALHFADYAQELRVEFSERIPQQIQALRTRPAVPKVQGFARLAASEDFDVFREWLLDFIREAVPNDPIPNDEALWVSLNQRRYWFWIFDNEPVSMAAIARRTKNAATINSVFTPFGNRNRGFAGAVTAAAAEQIFSEGRNAVCLYTDLRNPASNRCYAKLGFQPVCNSWLILRQKVTGL